MRVIFNRHMGNTRPQARRAAPGLFRGSVPEPYPAKRPHAHRCPGTHVLAPAGDAAEVEFDDVPPAASTCAETRAAAPR
jgi:hypothetical protein